jgi:hypothetical protein
MYTKEDYSTTAGFIFKKKSYFTSFKDWRQNGKQSEETASAKAHASCLSNFCQGNKNNCILIAATSHSTVSKKKKFLVMSKKHEEVLICTKNCFFSPALSVCPLHPWVLGYRHSAMHKAIYNQNERFLSFLLRVPEVSILLKSCKHIMFTHRHESITKGANV